MGGVSDCVQQPARSVVSQKTRRRITLKVATAISQQAPEEEAEAASGSVFLFVVPFHLDARGTIVERYLDVKRHQP